jgi:hypothetical protein
MKKFFFIAVAAMAIAACAKTEVDGPATSAISFQPVNQLNTKVTGSVFPTDDTFGTYAWTDGTAGEYFIENQEVSFNATGNFWSTATPYYWPKNQTVDFFSYYPYNVTGAVPQVAKTQIKYNDIDFTATQKDLMYADKAVGYTDNANQVEDGQNAFEGVPTIFRHAGAKVKVNIILGENSKTEAVTGTETKWDVQLKQVVLSGIYTKGSVTLNLSSTGTGIIPWTKPVDANGYSVWTPDATITNDEDNTLYKDVQVRDLVKGVGQNVIPEFYALPQVLVADQQKIALTVKITTYRKLANETEFTQVLVQDNKVVSADLLIDTQDLNTSVFAWQMNQAITYNITLGPAGKQITFDPAVDAWDAKTYATNIDLDI